MSNSDNTKERAKPEFFLSPEKNILQELTLEDIDTAVLNHFKNHNFKITKENKDFQDVECIFATEESWKKAEIEKGVLDYKRKILLPVIGIVRPSLVQNINRYVFKNQDSNVLIYKQPIKEMSNDFLRKFNNPLTKDNINKEVYRIIQIPYPEFFDITYKIEIISNFISHSNQLFQQIYKDIYFWIKTESGYGFHSSLSEPTTNEIPNPKDNTRKISIEFNLVVKAYLITKELINQSKQNYFIKETATRLEINEELITNYAVPLGIKPKNVLRQ